jgi:hypothetical protein
MLTWGVLGCGRSIRSSPGATAGAESSAGADGGGGLGGAGATGAAGFGGDGPAVVPEELVSLPRASSCPAGLAVDERDIFWIGTSEAGDVEIKGAPKTGGEARLLAVLPAPLAKGPPHVIAVDDFAVYVAGADSDGLSEVLAIEKGGGEPRGVAPFGAVGLLADPLGLFIAAAGADPAGIYALTGENAEPQHVVGTEAGVFRELAVDSSHLYWTSGNTLYRVPRTGGLPVILHDNVESFPGVLAVDSGEVYWADRDGWLKSTSIDGAAPTSLAEFRAGSLEARRRTAYSVGSLAGVKGLLRVNATHGATFLRGAFVDSALALDDAFVYLVRCAFVCPGETQRADCPDYEYNVSVVRVPED